jgi:hypothetical protein
LPDVDSEAGATADVVAAPPTSWSCGCAGSPRCVGLHLPPPAVRRRLQSPTTLLLVDLHLRPERFYAGLRLPDLVLPWLSSFSTLGREVGPPALYIWLGTCGCDSRSGPVHEDFRGSVIMHGRQTVVRLSLRFPFGSSELIVTWHAVRRVAPAPVLRTLLPAPAPTYINSPASTTSSITTAARGRAALKGWCSVMVVGSALGLGPLL